jgi:hypothetical protein
MRLSIVVQHHPERPLTGPLSHFEVIDDPEPDAFPSAIRTYIECLRSVPENITHRLVLQDDVTLAADFHSKVEMAIYERPSTLISYFVPRFGLHGRWMREAAARGDRWVQLPTSVNWQPAVAVCWPRGLALDFVGFAEEHVAGRLARRMTTTGDDPVIGAFCRARKLPMWATVPSLVQHPDVGWSFVKGREYHGTNPARQAAVFDES